MLLSLIHIYAFVDPVTGSAQSLQALPGHVERSNQVSLSFGGDLEHVEHPGLEATQLQAACVVKALLCQCSAAIEVALQHPCLRQQPQSVEP